MHVRRSADRVGRLHIRGVGVHHVSERVREVESQDLRGEDEHHDGEVVQEDDAAPDEEARLGLVGGDDEYGDAEREDLEVADHCD